ncbi:MAG: DUF433 domain-containing protein [Thermodesulfovibrionales bacterium]|nr:DUF433 domain-containing protein [Thermodesulfovibrionales bacterium]
MDWRDRIAIDPAVLVGKPIIKGTRIAVEFVIDLLAQGWTEPEILRNYPGLTHEDILACLKYAGETLDSEKVFPLHVA